MVAAKQHGAEQVLPRGRRSRESDPGRRDRLGRAQRRARRVRRGDPARRDGGGRLLRARRHRLRHPVVQAGGRARGDLGSREARAAAYWNASVMESQSGSVAAAIPLAERALALLSEGENARNLARLRSQLGVMQLQSDPPLGSEALENLGRAATELAQCEASPVDVARNDVALARAFYQQGELSQARELARQTYDVTRDVAPLLAADARALEGQALAAEGAWPEAKAAYRDAVMTLTGVGRGPLGRSAVVGARRSPSRCRRRRSRSRRLPECCRLVRLAGQTILRRRQDALRRAARQQHQCASAEIESSRWPACAATSPEALSSPTSARTALPTPSRRDVDMC